MGDRLKSWQFDMGIVSDLKRARATAKAILDQSTSLQTLVEWNSVRERNFGEFEGRPQEELRIVEETIHESENLHGDLQKEKQGFNSGNKYKQYYKIFTQSFRIMRKTTQLCCF